MRISQINFQTSYKPQFGKKDQYGNERDSEYGSKYAGKYGTQYAGKYGSQYAGKYGKSTDRKKLPPKHPEFWSPDYQECLAACRKYANSLKRPDPCSMDYYDQLEDWNEYSIYRTKK